jgi:hypothetical protein
MLVNKETRAKSLWNHEIALRSEMYLRHLFLAVFFGIIIVMLIVWCIYTALAGDIAAALLMAFFILGAIFTIPVSELAAFFYAKKLLSSPGELFTVEYNGFLYLRVKLSENSNIALMKRISLADIMWIEVSEGEEKYLKVYGENGLLADMPYKHTQFDTEKFAGKPVKCND